MNPFAKLLMSAALFACGVQVSAQKNPDVGDVTMPVKKTVLQAVDASPIHTRLKAGIQSAGLTGTLEGAGPFTVFAPTDDAFAKLSAGTVTGLMKPESNQQLTRVLQYHVVPGKLTLKKLRKLIKKSGGTASLKTLEGGTLTAKMSGSILILTDDKGGEATVTTADVVEKNGVMDVVDSVLMPE